MPKHSFLSLLYLYLLLGSCGGETSVNNKVHTLEQQLQDTTTEDELIKTFLKSNAYQAGFKSYGKPEKIEFFFLKPENITEFRIELLNHFKQGDLERPIPIIELSWSYNAWKNITRWYRKSSSGWEEVHTMVWSKGSEF